MPASVLLEFIQGPLKDRNFSIEERTVYLIGRDKDCSVCIPTDPSRKISRHHFPLSVEKAVDWHQQPSRTPERTRGRQLKRIAQGHPIKRTATFPRTAR